MKKCLLIYYTGTNNTKFLTEKIRDRLVLKGYRVDSYQVKYSKMRNLDLSQYDVIGIGYPIHAFNTPYALLRFIRQQKFQKDQQVFIYKNSGETRFLNRASSISLLHKIKRDGARCDNEYHFVMPYNIRFRFDDHLIKEMLDMNELLLDILVKEITENIRDINLSYGIIPLITNRIFRIQYIGGAINSFFYKVDKVKCNKCMKCIINCPSNNIYLDKRARIKFHHHCQMCMKCSFECPKNAISIGILQGWKVNGPYDFEKIARLKNKKLIINKNTKGFFKCYKNTFKNIKIRHQELFGY